MRFVYAENELADKFDDAQHEAKAAFGDGHMYVEKVMTNVRHIEMQIIATNKAMCYISRT